MTDNPFASKELAKQSGAMATAMESREIQEVQAAMVIAQRFPRDERRAMDRILNACTRKTLAETALYSYNRGGQEVTGPSIRLAEVLAQAWGNIQSGVRELEQTDEDSVVEVFAWDLETNTRDAKVFRVPHVRHTQAGAKKLTDPRDI
jgi:ABC-type hemin transport system ATPase subunit